MPSRVLRAILRKGSTPTILRRDQGKDREPGRAGGRAQNEWCPWPSDWKIVRPPRLYQKVIDDLDELVGAVGLKAA
jgi:hypothetical protein